MCTLYRLHDITLKKRTSIMKFILGFVVFALSIVGSMQFKSCCDVASGVFFRNGKKSSGVYTLQNFCGYNFSVQAYCDTITDGGGWIVIQRRKDGSVDFNRFWWEYEVGFGTLTGEFWLGLKALHCLTYQGSWEMKFEFLFPNKSMSYLHYNVFKVGPAVKGYPLTIGGYTGIHKGDPFSTHPLNGMKFSTKDRDNDKLSGRNCVFEFGKPLNGWWYNRCSHIDANAYYGLIYVFLGDREHRLPFTEIKIRPHRCTI